MKTKQINVLAIDLGASSGRAVVGSFDGCLAIEEVHRFPNFFIEKKEGIYWDLKYLEKELASSIQKAAKKYEIESLAIDTWGVDYVLLDKDFIPISNPRHYRDPRVKNAFEQVAKAVSLEEIYSKTGIQLMEINTLFQLFMEGKAEEQLLNKTRKILMMPDYFNYYLTGKMYTERSIASTTSLLNIRTSEWDESLLELVGAEGKMCQIIEPSKKIGFVKKRFSETSIKLFSCASHDTQSAMMLIPSDNTIFLSSGTWSLFGLELERAHINISNLFDTTNEQAYGGKIAYIKNLTGLWILQQLKNQLSQSEQDYSYSDLEDLAKQGEPFKIYIDTEDPQFSGTACVRQSIEEFLERTNQSKGQNLSQIVRAIYEGLAFKYKQTLEIIRKMSKKKIESIFIVGGGSKDKFLCQLIANVCQLKVIVGPEEATVYGNILAQLIGLGAIPSLEIGRKLIFENQIKIEFTPEIEDEIISKKHEKYKKFTKENL